MLDLILTKTQDNITTNTTSVNKAIEMKMKVLYSRHTNISRNIIKHNIRTSMNERMNTLLYKNIISHTLFSKGLMLVVCER